MVTVGSTRVYTTNLDRAQPAKALGRLFPRHDEILKSLPYECLSELGKLPLDDDNLTILAAYLHNGVEGDEYAGLAPSEAMRKLGGLLDKQRMTAGMTRREVAAAAKCSEAMVSRVLNGKQAPSNRLLVALASAMRTEPAVFRSRWQPLWQATQRKTPPPAGPVPDEPTAAAETGLPAGFECSECGSWVTNPNRHLQWHLQWQPRHGDTDAQVVPLRQVS
jgi:transcriptional regulator with XRE-family HTH domain